MTTSRSVMLISLIALILAAFVPAVSALEVIYDEPITEYITTSKTGIQTPSIPGTWYGPDHFGDEIGFWDITKAQDLRYLVIEVPGDQGYWAQGYPNLRKIDPGINEFTYYQNGKWRRVVLDLERKTGSSGEVTSTVFTLYFPEWNIGNSKGTVAYSLPMYFTYGYLPPENARISSETNAFVSLGVSDVTGTYFPPLNQPIKITEVSGIDWKHHLKVEEHSGIYYIVVNGFIDGQRFTSEVVLKKGAVIHSNYTNTGERIELAVAKSEIDILEIISPSGTRYVYPLFGDGPYYPLRTVKVTMTDIDGNKISGFDVKAVNSYTGESYTVSTDSDVAYIALPMDRTARVPNPQTGEYEEATVGYYLFYGYKPGYKMVPDWGIQVNILPAKYMPDIFCDIIVAPTGSLPDPDDPNSSPVYVYVRNAQTGALLADAIVIIKDARTDPWTEVVNQTLPSGQGTFYLANDPANNPNQYFITALVPGYSDIYNGRYFRVAGPIYIYIYMEPIEGGPVDENKTFLEFYVRDPDGNPVSDAVVSVSVVDVARLTNAQGWTQFEVPKNAAYSYIVRKSGYSTIEGRVTVGDVPRHTVNVVLNPTQPPGPGVPTLPTPVKPSPTLTAPTGEPVSNLLEWFAAHFGMILGGGVEIGQIFMWLCFTIPTGVYVGNKAKAGAAGFMAGAGIVTLFFVIIGWVPIWLVVILSLIIGLLYAKAFSNIGNGGGR